MPPWAISPDLRITSATYMLSVCDFKMRIKALFTQEKTPILVTAFFFPFILDHPEKRERLNYL